jgi:hypothetical protein
MPRASTEAIKTFNEALERCFKEIDKRQIQIDIECVYRLVWENKEAAYAATELKCMMARHQPNYLKVTPFLAWAYKYYFQDDGLISLVKNAARAAVAQGAPSAEQVATYVDQTLEELSNKALGDAATRFINNMSEELTNRIVIVPTRGILPERAREAAQKWWQETGKIEAQCDTCSKPMQPGEGYAISGRLQVIRFRDGSKQVTDLGEELICEICSKDILDSLRI